MGYISPWLYAKTSKGAIKVWQIEAKNNIMIIRNGLEGGKIKEQTKIITGKNQGKSNATTDEEQAILESKSKFQKKINEQYVENRDNVSDYAEKAILLPMLAQPYEKRKHDIKFPCYVQPKLNGVRCIFQNGKFISRSGKEYTTLEHLRPELEKLDIKIPDGEIYVHGMSFQEIIRLVKKGREDGSNAKLEYWIYDQVNELTFENRSQYITDQFGDNKYISCKHVSTIKVHSEEEIKEWHDKFVQQGFEGVIIRNKDGKYAVKHRSADLQKLKYFHDAEYKIVGGKPGTGSMEGCCVFELETEDGKRFSAMSRGSVEIRRKQYQELDQYINCMATVRYQELSEEQTPIFPVIVCLSRDYE